MKLSKDGTKIVSASYDELYKMWISQGWSDIMSFSEYVNDMKYKGVKITRGISDADNKAKR